MKIKLDTLKFEPYFDNSLGQQSFIDFDFSDIEKAIEEKRFDTRSFQDDIEELKAEWNKNANNNYEEYLKYFKKYHIERIACLVASGLWTYPILVYKDLTTVKDGQHRIWAAKYLNQAEIEATIYIY